MAQALQVPLGEYIFRRISSLGVRHIIGVPGDFNYNVYSVPELKWVGCCNELNAAYAADGYTRVRRLPAALVTTYGVGELSAMNGVAGAYAEHAGMIHIVGMTSRSVQKSKPVIHHTLEPGMDHTLYMGMSAPIRHTHAFLTDEATFTQEVDRVIEACFRSRLPCYLFVPMDTTQILVDASPLERPLSLEVRNHSTTVEDEIVSAILSAIKSRREAVILADVLTIRHGGQDALRELAETTRFPSFACPLSKGIIDEDKEYFNGVYAGKLSFPGICDTVESAELVINVGPLLSDSNTGGYTRRIKDENLVLLAHDRCEIFGQVFSNVHFLPVLKRVVADLIQTPAAFGLPRTASRKRIETPRLRADTKGPIFQDFAWQRLARFLQPGDIILTDCGTAQFGMFDAVLPPNATTITSVFWSSIGFAVGACLGACLAAKEQSPGGRVILIVGDGSLQMTVQEISTCIRYGLNPIIFVVNNSGYSIERAIHGAELDYNDINTSWDYQGLLSFFGARLEAGIPSVSVQCATVAEFEKTLDDPTFRANDCIQLCEIIMDKFDYPWRLATQIEMVLGTPLAKQLKVGEQYGKASGHTEKIPVRLGGPNYDHSCGQITTTLEKKG